MILLHHREYVGGWRQQGRYVKLKLQQTASFIVAESLDAPPERTHLHPARCLNTTERVAWITFSCLSLIRRCKNSVRPVSPDIRLEADWLKCAASQCKLLCWPADIHSVTRSPHSSSSCHTPATTRVAKRRAQGRNSQSEQNKRDLPMRTFRKI